MIRKDANQVVFENPGSIRTGKEQMLRGGISDPRNKTLLKMFNLIGIGERAGSGVPDIYAIWEKEGWRAPEIEEQYGPDRTVLTLSLEDQPKVPKHQSTEKHGALDDAIVLRIIEILKEQPAISQEVLGENLGMTRRVVQKYINTLKESGRIERIGGKRFGHWEVLG